MAIKKNEPFFLHEIHLELYIHLGANLPEELEAHHSSLLTPSSIVHATCYVTGEHLTSIWSKGKSVCKVKNKQP